MTTARGRRRFELRLHSHLRIRQRIPSCVSASGRFRSAELTLRGASLIWPMWRNSNTPDCSDDRAEARWRRSCDWRTMMSTSRGLGHRQPPRTPLPPLVAARASKTAQRTSGWATTLLVVVMRRGRSSSPSSANFRRRSRSPPHRESRSKRKVTRMAFHLSGNGPIALASSLILLGLPCCARRPLTLVRTSGGSVRFHESGFRNPRGDRNVARPRIESRIAGRRRRRPHVAQRSRPRTSAASETHRPFNIPPSQTESVVRFSVG